MGDQLAETHGDPASWERLSLHKARILARWEARVRERIPAAVPEASPILIDSMPELLDDIVGALLHCRQAATTGRNADCPAAEHGRDRARLPAYALEAVLSEHQILRQVLFEVLEEERALSPRERDTLLDVLQVALHSTAQEFTAQRDAERAASALALKKANEELARHIKQRTAELAESEERFRRLVEGVKDYSIFTVDVGGYITTWNAGAQRMKGYTAEEIIGQHFSVLYPEEGRARNEPMDHLKSAASEGRFRGEGIRIRKNRERFLADVLITPMYEEGRLIGFSKVVADLTERNMLIQERDLSRTEARQTRQEQEARERFVATLVHDLRSPLQAAKTSAELITQAPADSEQARARTLKLIEILNRADQMLSDLLDTNRLRAGERLSLEVEECDLRQIAEERCEELATRYGDRFVLRSDPDVRGWWSRKGLHRLLDNLLSNALKYGEPREPITIRIRRIADSVLLAVHNKGTLIPPEEQEKLFQPYHRTVSAETSGKQGWGLGLTLVRGVVEAHGGMVKVESYSKEGTTFSVHLPLDARQPPREGGSLRA